MFAVPENVIKKKSAIYFRKAVQDKNYSSLHILPY